jgi:hypothetical protein
MTDYEPDEVTETTWHEPGQDHGHRVHAGPDVELTSGVVPDDDLGEEIEEPPVPDWDPGDEIDDEGGMSEYQYDWPDDPPPPEAGG